MEKILVILSLYILAAMVLYFSEQPLNSMFTYCVGIAIGTISGRIWGDK